MKVLVTGANGFIGGHLVEFLCTKQLAVRCWVHADDNSRFPISRSGIELVRGDLTDAEFSNTAVAGCDIVLHLAGLSRYDARVPASEYIRVNVEGTRSLLEACRRNHVKRFIFVSSIEAVGLSTNGRPLTEASEPHPRNPYGESKLLAENVVRNFHAKYGMDCQIVRLGATYGPRERLVFERMFQPISKGFYLLFGDGSALVEFSYVKNQVHGIWQTSVRGKPGETYFLSDDRPYAFREVVEEISRQIGGRLRLVRVPVSVAMGGAAVCEALSKVLPFHPFRIAETGRPPFSRSTMQWAAKSALYCDNSKAKKDLEYRPPYSLQQGLGETVQWYRDQGWL